MKNANPVERAASLSFRQLKLFESVGRLKSVRKASEECSLSQPAVTQALAKLEREVGVALLERRASGSYLNDLGLIFHRRTARLFEQIEQALVELDIPGGAAAAPTVAKRISRSQIRSLIAIAESNSFAQAAQALGLSQASLQRAARDLEGSVRKALYYRTAAGVMVTPAGVEFGRRMKLAAQEIEWGMKEIEAAQGSSNSQIVIGAMPSGGSVLLASVLEEFVAAHPNADVRITNENAAELIKSLKSGDVDLVIGLIQPSDEGLTQEPLAKTPYAVVARQGHRLSRCGQVTLDDLAAYDWVIGRVGSSRRACFERLFDVPRPRAPISTCSLPVILQLLAGSDRLTLMTSYELMHEGNALVAIPVGPIEPVPEIGITTRADWLPTQLHAAFIDLIRRRMAEAEPVRPRLRRVG